MLREIRQTGISRLTQVVDSISGTITLTWDDFDRLTREVTPQGTVDYVYDAAGRRVTMTVAGQPIVNYSYDNADRLTGITQGSSTVTFEYDNADRRTKTTLPSGVSTEYFYDDAGQLTRIDYKQGNTLIGDLSYQYDAAGNRIAMGGSFGRTGLPQPLASAVYDAANRLTQWGGVTLTYDDNGNLTGDETNSYTWNARNQMVSMTGASFQYDAFGRRKSKTVGGSTTQFLYDGVNVVQELSANTANLLTGLGVDEMFTRTDSAGARHYLTDGLGSTLALANPAGAVQTGYTYEPYGKVGVSGVSAANPFQYTGRENDDTGLYYYRARYYHPGLQRFIAEDPIGLLGGVNFYSYVSGNPTSLIDPWGLAGCYVAYPGYPITIPGTNVKVPLTHAGVLSYDSQGHTRYYEYGRYDSDFGNVRRHAVPNLKIGLDGKPTAESWDKLLDALNKIGHGTKAKTSCDEKADADKINNFAEQRKRDPNRAPYTWNPFRMNTCTTFASDALAAGRK